VGLHEFEASTNFVACKLSLVTLRVILKKEQGSMNEIKDLVNKVKISPELLKHLVNAAELISEI